MKLAEYLKKKRNREEISSFPAFEERRPQLITKCFVVVSLPRRESRPSSLSIKERIWKKIRMLDFEYLCDIRERRLFHDSHGWRGRNQHCGVDSCDRRDLRKAKEVAGDVYYKEVIEKVAEIAMVCDSSEA